MRAAPLFALWLLGCVASPPSTSLYDHPWPDERMRRPDGTIDVSGFPSFGDSTLREQSLSALSGARGFGLATPFVFPLERALDPDALPDVEGSLAPDASVFVVNVDRGSEAFGARAPVDVRFLPDGGPFGGTNLLVALPYPGIPLAPDTLYAAVVTTSTRREDGSPLPADATEGPSAVHAEALDALEALGVPRDRIAARAVVRTGDPTAELRAAVEQALGERVTITEPALVEEHADYCVYRASTEMPVYQGGAPPYTAEGGGWVRDAAGALVVQARLTSRVWITVPRSSAARYPSAVLVRAGAGGDRPLVDRGPRDASGWSEPGAGIARELAQAGYVGLSVDGPLGGARNLEGWDEQTAIFNLVNPTALRDNVRQTAVELVLFRRALAALSFDGSGCDGASSRIEVEPDPVLIGHSTGATIAPLAAAVEPGFAALVLSGAGASWIRQVVHKQSPVPLRPFVEAFVGYWPHRELVEHDPILGLLQWAGEPADPMVYGRLVQDRPALVFQGVLDTYIPPPIANPLALSLGLDLAGDPLDTALDRPAMQDLPLVGGRRRALPADLVERPRVVTQLLPDGIEDGHEVLFQRADARAQLRCFLATLAAGAPVLIAPGGDCEAR